MYIIALLTLCLLTSLPVSIAAEPLSSTSHKISRNDLNLGGNSSLSDSNKLFSDILSAETFSPNSANFKLYPAIANLIVHPNTITELTGLESADGEVTLTWSAPQIMDGYNSSTGTYFVKWSSLTPLNSETAYESATTFNQNWTPLSPGNQETGRVVRGLPVGATIYISIKAQDNAGNRAYVSIGSASVTGIFVSSRPTPPTGLVGTAISSSAILWEWQDNSGNETGYRVMASTGGSISGNLPVSTTFFLQTDLLGPNTSFSVVIESFNQFWISSTTPLTRFTSANPPIHLSLNAISSSSITAQWDKNFNPELITSYQLDVSIMNSFILLSGSSSTVLTTATISNLVSNTSYFYRVTSFNGDGIASSPTLFVTTVTLAAPPTLSGFVVSLSSITVSWSSNTNPTDTLYTIQVSTDPNYSVFTQTQTYFLEFTTQSLTSNTAYYFKGKAANRMEIETAYMDFGSRATWTRSPIVLGIDVFVTSVTVRLGSNDNPVGTKFQVSTGSFELTNTTEGVTQSGIPAAILTVVNLIPNTTYSFDTRAVNFEGVVSSITVVGRTATLASIPQVGTFSAVWVSSMTVNWSLSGEVGNNPEGTEFLLERSTTASFSSLLGQTAWISLFSSVPVSLSPNTTYYHRLKARNWQLLESPYSQVFATSTLATLPGAPTFSKVWRTSISVVLEDLAIVGNPSYTQFAIFNVTASSWLGGPIFGESSLGNDPAWFTYAQWGGAGGVSNIGLESNTAYTYRLKARNSLLIETDLGPVSMSTTTLVGAPQVLVSTPAVNVWVNYTTAAFQLGGSSIFHYRYNTNATDSADHNSDPVHFFSDSPVLITTITAEGSNYLHLRGENSFHSFVDNLTYGPIQVDTTPPINVSIFSVVPTTFTMSVTADVAVDPLSALASEPYQFEELTGNLGSIGITPYQVDTSTTDEGLQPNTSYTYRIRAKDMAGNLSNFSSPVTTVTLAALPVCGQATNIFMSSITVNWTNPYNNPSDTNYTVQFSTSPDFIGSLSSSKTFSLFADLSFLTPNTSYYFRVKATNRHNLDTTWVQLGSTVTGANAVTTTFIDGVFISSAIFSWVFPVGNPSDTRYVVELSTNDFKSIYRSSVTVINSAILKPLRPSTDFKVGIAAINRLGVRTPHVGVGTLRTGDVQPLSYEIGITSMSILWDKNVADSLSEFLIEIATLSVGGSTSSFTAQSWTQNISSWTFTQLSTNTQYSFQVSWRESSAEVPVPMVSGATRTFAAVPLQPTVVPVGFEVANLLVNPASNPTEDPNNTEFAIFVAVSIPPNSPHNQKYLSLDGNMNNAGSVPVWRTYAQWGGAASTVITNVIGGSVYNFSVKARNGRRVETNFSPSVSVVTFPGAPKISWQAGLPQSSWINVLVTSFTVSNSAHYHFRFNQNENDTDNVSSVDPGVASNEVVSVTATVEGAWYFHSLGDTFGFQGDQNHTPLGSSKFKFNIDITPPTVTELRAKFSPTDPTAIAHNVDTPHKQPYFTWKSSVTDVLKESLIEGYSILFATGTDPGDVGVGNVILTTEAKAYFAVAVSSHRPTATYYFRVKAKDVAGNWGPSSVFIYKILEDVVKPKPIVRTLSSFQTPDGRFLGVKSSVTLSIQFSEEMKEETLVSTQSVWLLGVRDNLAMDQNLLIELKLTYNPETRTLQFSPVKPLPRGWLFEFTVSTAVKDLGENPIEKAFQIQFETLMDRTVPNRVIASDGKTVVHIPANALMDDVSVSVTLISGSRGSPGLTEATPAWVTDAGQFYKPQFASQQSMNEANEKIVTRLGTYAQPVTIREFNALLEDGQAFTSNFQVPVTITIPYLDVDNDGYVDGTSPKVKVKNLSIFVLDEKDHLWQKVPSGTLDLQAKTVSAQVIHFSVYSIFGAADLDVSESYAYPVPFKPSQGHRNITFAFLPSQGTIRIYSVAGELVKKIDFNDPVDGKLDWDVTNSNGEALGSDVFVYQVQTGDNKKFGKLMVIR